MEENMIIKRKELYVEDLIEIIENLKVRLNEMKQKLTVDEIINKGLFVMSSSIFEDSIRSILKEILLKYPQKLKDKSYTISRKVVHNISLNGFEVIIDHALFKLFHEGVKEQLLYAFKIISNKVEKDLLPESLKVIDGCEEVSWYRNALIHNGGRPTQMIINQAKYHRNEKNDKINFNKDLVSRFINEYSNISNIIKNEVIEKFTQHRPETKIKKLKKLWSKCFNSPLLSFDSYWSYCTEKDIVIDAKFTSSENALSSGESVLLSIWRSQFNDVYKAKSFIVLNINYDLIYEMYKVFDEVKFFYMHQIAIP